MPETVIKFNAHYQYVWLKNIGTGDCYVSDHPNIVAEADDVAYLPVGEATMLTMQNNDVYVLGDTVVEAHAQNFAESPFLDVIITGGGGEPTLITKTVTTNGTYNASSDSADGYSSVTVNVAQDVELMTRVQWDALTTAQKQAKGLVAIQDTNSGYERGQLVNGADYVQPSAYIPYSDVSDIIAEAYVDNFDATADNWGGAVYADNTKKPEINVSENAVAVDATSGVVPYVSLGQTSKPFTAYVVLKCSGASQYTRLMSCTDELTSNHGLALVGSSIYVATFQNDTQTGISSTSYFVGCLRYGTSSAGFVYDSSVSDTIKVNKSPAAVGTAVTLGKMSPTISGDEGNLLVKYFAVVDGAEDNSVIDANIRSLYSTFIGA